LAARPPLRILPVHLKRALLIMRTNIGAVELEATQTVEKRERDGMLLEVVQYTDLRGSRNILAAEWLDAAKRAGMLLRFLRAQLRATSIKVEPGLLHYMHGQLKVRTKSAGGKGLAGFVRGKINAYLTGETSHHTVVSGQGTVVLEPTFGHYLLIELEGEELIADRGVFVAGSEHVGVGVEMQKNVSSSLFGGEGLFQTKVQGHGMVAFNSPVHPDELIRVDLDDETLQVDGNFSVMRTAGLQFTAEPSSKSLYSAYTSGEGLMQVFRGSGSVWLAPTEALYQHFEQLRSLRREWPQSKRRQARSQESTPPTHSD
jgi:uncharacterized protein (AIM24 family)